METNINIIIKTTSDNTGLEALEGATEAADQSTKKLDESQKKQGKTAKNSSKANAGLAGTFKSLASQLLAVAAAYTSYNVLVKDAINLAGVQVKAENNLLNALNNRAKAAGKDSDLAKRQLASLKSLASAKQEDLGIGDESILQASRWFVSAGANIEQIERLIEVTADLSEATGTGLNESAKGLSRIFTNLSGSLEELRSKGVAFTDAEMEMIKHMDSTNQKAEAQEIVLKKLEGTFGGSAKAAVNAFGGDLKRTLEGLINVFSSTEAKQFVATLSGIGGAFQAFGSITLGPVLDSLGQTFKNLVKDMSNFSKGLENAGSDSAIVVGVLAQGFSVVGSVIVGITNNVISLGKALGSLLTLNPVTIKNAFADLGETMVNSVANAGKEVAKLFDKEHLKKQGAAIGKAMSEASARNYNITIDKLNSTPGSWSVPEPNQSDIDASAKRTADLLKAGAEGGPVGAAIMTGMVTGLIANVIGSAVQLASAANQSFDVPAPVKSFYTGGVVPLKEGNQFMIGGAMGMEERATVRGGNLYIDNAVTTRNLPQENQGLSITVQNMTVQTPDPEDFAEQMKNLFRREQYL